LTFNDDEIERERRSAQRGSGSNVDPATKQAEHDFLQAARADTPDELQRLLLKRGIKVDSDIWRRTMQQYWAIRRAR
jgi:hypothetical protein